MSASHPCEAPYLPFDAHSSHWQDVQPTFQDDGHADVLVEIMYDPAYSSAMDLFRTLYPKREYSARTLALTTHLAALNPSSYSVWSYRADILLDGRDEALGGESRSIRLARELDWMEEMARGNMKSYQVWQHRRLILSALGDPSRELAFISSVLAKDAKNYHTWAYRQWVLSEFGGLHVSQRKNPPPYPQLWDGELAYTDKLLDQDVRNNSAWNHRFFVVFRREALSDKEEKNRIVEREVAVTKACLSSVPSNPAAWSYLRGVLTDQSQSPLSSYGLVAFARNLIPPPSTASTANSSLALEYLLDVVLEGLEGGIDIESIRKEVAPSSQSLPAFVQEVVARLTEEDPIRQRWWHKLGEDAQEWISKDHVAVE